MHYEEIMACIILKDNETLTDTKLKEYIMSHMAKHKVPKYKMREDAVKRLNIKKVAGIVTK